MNDSAEIRRFIVSKSHRRKGIGSLLLSMREFCLKHEYKRLTASTMSVLKGAIEFYKTKDLN